MSDNSLLQTDWGYEVIWAKKEGYCGKILVFEKSNKKLPLHFHKFKSKSWFVNAGKFKVQWVDTTDGKIYAQELIEGSVFHVPALMPVMLESLTDNSAMAEVGSDNEDTDFYRLN